MGETVSIRLGEKEIRFKEDVSAVVQREIEKKEVQKMMEESMKREELAARLRNPVESPAPIAENKEDIDEIIRIVPKKPSWKEKLFARIIIVAAVLVVLTGILTFWYWYFKIRTQPPIIENGEEIEVPVALFEIKDMATIDFSNQEDLLSQLKDLIEIWHPDNRFKRIILKRLFTKRQASFLSAPFCQKPAKMGMKPAESAPTTKRLKARSGI